MRNRATTLKPLDNLHRAGEIWVWSDEGVVFQESKTELLTNRVLVHYDSKRALKLDYDASQYGVGAVLDNREERPIAFASRSLKKSETNYAQLEKEVPQISVWPFLHSRDRSSPVSHNSGTNQGRPTTSSCENAALGSDFAGILI